MYRALRDRKNTAFFFFKGFGISWSISLFFLGVSRRCLRSLVSSSYKALVKFLYAFRNIQAFKLCKSTAPFQTSDLHVMKKADIRLTFISRSLHIKQHKSLNSFQDRKTNSCTSVNIAVINAYTCQMQLYNKSSADKHLAYTCLLVVYRYSLLPIKSLVGSGRWLVI